MTDTYVAAVTAAECFVDHTYQRIQDVARARKIAAGWDRRLVGLIEVSDRGPDATPRYAVIDGQHRWAAAGFLQDPPQLVANVHEGLTVEQEAELFDKLNRQRKQPTTWDHWKARRVSGDPIVAAIEQIAAQAGLHCTENAGTPGGIFCTSTMEKVAASAGGLDLLGDTLIAITTAWGYQRAAVESPVVHGLAMVIHTFGPDRLTAGRLNDALQSIPPQRIRLAATTLRDASIPGSLAKLTAMAFANHINQATAGARLNWPNNWRGVLPKPPADTPAPKPVPPQPTSVTETVRTGIELGGYAAGGILPDRPCDIPPNNLPAKVTPGYVIPAAAAKRLGVGSEILKQLNANPPAADVDDDLDAQVRSMSELPISAVADELGITISEVRQIRARIGTTA